MNQYDRLLDLMSGLKAAHIHFNISNVREEAIMLHVAVPGERWEIELLRSGKMEIENSKATEPSTTKPPSATSSNASKTNLPGSHYRASPSAIGATCV